MLNKKKVLYASQYYIDETTYKLKVFEERYEEKASYSNNIPTTSTTRR